MLSPEELARYNRQILLPEVGVAGQERFKAARVLIVGAGGLGSPVALYLAAAGVGTLGIADSDDVEPSNLHRQVLHGTDDIGRAKTASATDAIRRLNPSVVIEAHPVRVDRDTARALIESYDLVIDGSDNYSTRYAINDACAALSKAWVYGSVERFSGQIAVFGTPGGPCYRCIFPEAPAPGTTASCEEIGVLGAVPGVIGALQATEALKLILGLGSRERGRMLQLDLLRAESRWVEFSRRVDCAACGTRSDTAVSRNPMKDDFPPIAIEPSDVPARLRAGGARLLDVREPWELRRAAIAGATSIPMSALENEVTTLNSTEELIVFCHHGSRSSVVTDWLRSQGFRARNLTGGIDRWSREVDATVPRY